MKTLLNILSLLFLLSLSSWAQIEDTTIISKNMSNNIYSEEPVSEEPVSEEPVSEVPVSEVPVSEVPVSEVPAAEVPAAEVPVAEEDSILTISDYIAKRRSNKNRKKFLEVGLSIMFGATSGKIESSNHLSYYFNPTSNVNDLTSPHIRTEIDFKFLKIIGISFGLQYEKIGQYTKPTSVEFKNDPFIHEFESKAEVQYLSIPININLGYHFNKHWIDARFGIVPAYKYKDTFEWKVDNIVNTQLTPNVDATDYDVRLMYGLEYGFKIKKNGIFILLNFQKGINSFVESEISGEAFTKIWNYSIGYKRFF